MSAPFRRRASLMTRLVTSFLILSVLMVAVVGFVAYDRAKASLQGQVFDRLDAASQLRPTRSSGGSTSSSATSSSWPGC